MKKLLAIVISMAMLVAMMPMGVFAETPGELPSGGSIHTERGIIAAHLTDNATDNPINYDTLNKDYKLTYNEGTITIDVKGIPHKNGNGNVGKWVGIAVPIHSEATSLVWNVNDGADINDDLSSNWPKNGVSYATLYWAYDKTDVQKIKYTFKEDDTVICSEELNVVVNATGDTDVAKIGNRYFATLASAVAAVHDKRGADRTKENVIELLSDASGGGFGVGYERIEEKEGKYATVGNSPVGITIKMNEHKYTMVAPTVGSAGTETNGCQFLKGSNIKFENGIIRVENNLRCAYLFQNYANLTLKDMDVSIEGNLPCESLVHSMNGTVNIVGNTSLTSGDKYKWNDSDAGDQKVIDLLDWNNDSYSNGTQVTVNTTGNITGKINTGYYNPEDITASTGKSTLNIENGYFNGSFTREEASGEFTAPTITITGGTFSADPSAYVASGYYSAKNSDGKYTVYRYIPSTPSTPADNVTNNAADKNTTADLTPAVKDNKAETTVDAKTADKIVEKALENKSEEIIVDAAGNNTVASSEVAIPEKTVKEIAEKTDANLVIKTDNGKVDLDKTALAAVAAQAGTDGTVKLVVETVKTDADICHVNLKLVTSNGAVTDFKGGNVAVTINLTKELAAKDVVCVYINDNGIYTLVNGQKNADGTYTFTTGHFSEYAVMAKDEADKKIAEQLDTMIKDVNLKVRTSKTSKKNIKAVVSGDVKAITDAGYTVKYKFYRSEKKASKYEAKATKAGKTYINTAGKKGTKYYYKAKALVYDGDKLVGQTVLTQCKYGVRTWSK